MERKREAGPSFKKFVNWVLALLLGENGRLRTCCRRLLRTATELLSSRRKGVRPLYTIFGCPHTVSYFEQALYHEESNDSGPDVGSTHAEWLLYIWLMMCFMFLFHGIGCSLLLSSAIFGEALSFSLPDSTSKRCVRAFCQFRGLWDWHAGALRTRPCIVGLLTSSRNGPTDVFGCLVCGLAPPGPLLNLHLA